MITTPRISLALMAIFMIFCYNKSAQATSPDEQSSQEQGEFLILSEEMLEAWIKSGEDFGAPGGLIVLSEEMLETSGMTLYAEETNARTHLDLEQSLLAPTSPKQDLASFVQEGSDKLLLRASSALLNGASLSFALMAPTALSVVYLGTPYGLRVALPVAVVAGLAAGALHIIYFSGS